jgi:hypothetical protein
MVIACSVHNPSPYCHANACRVLVCGIRNYHHFHSLTCEVALRSVGVENLRCGCVQNARGNVRFFFLNPLIQHDKISFKTVQTPFLMDYKTFPIVVKPPRKKKSCLRSIFCCCCSCCCGRSDASSEVCSQGTVYVSLLFTAHMKGSLPSRTMLIRSESCAHLRPMECTCFYNVI